MSIVGLKSKRDSKGMKEDTKNKKGRKVNYRLHQEEEVTAKKFKQDYESKNKNHRRGSQSNKMERREEKRRVEQRAQSKQNEEVWMSSCNISRKAQKRTSCTSVSE